MFKDNNTGQTHTFKYSWKKLIQEGRMKEGTGTKKEGTSNKNKMR
jgi:hypothetical protein